MGAAVSLNFDCFSILTRVSEIYFATFFFLFFSDYYFYLEISVEKYLGFSAELFHKNVLNFSWADPLSLI